MHPSLYLSPTLDAALADALSRLEAARREQPLIQGWLLLPSSEAVAAARRQARTTPAGRLGLRLFQFYGLGQSVLDAAGSPVRPLGDAAIHRLVRHLLAALEAEGELSTFSGVRDLPGFQGALIDWLREMKSQSIPPDAVRDRPLLADPERDRQLARFYARYQEFLLREGYSDTDGMLWLAAEALEADPRLFASPGLFFVLGFDQFNPLQLRILRALAGRFDRFSLYLVWDPDRPVSSLALTRPAAALQRLQEVITPQVEILPPTGPQTGKLARLRRGLFEPTPPPSPTPDQAEEERDALRAVAAPSREAEVRSALRAIKALLLAGVPPHEIALLAPEPDVYRRPVEAVAAEYGIPIGVERRLGENPAASALLNLLRLPPDFPWRETLDALRSPYIRQPWLTPEQVEALDGLSRERPVLAGREQWLAALRPIPPRASLAAGGEALDDDLGPPRLAGRIPPEELAAIQNGLLAFFDHLTPPGPASLTGHIRWLQEAVLDIFPSLEDLPEPVTEPIAEPAPVVIQQGAPVSLHLVEASREGPAPHRDLEALVCLLKALGELAEAGEQVPIQGAERLPFDAFLRELLELLPQRTLPPDPARPVVRFASIYAGRETAVDHLFILGLSEGEFPRSPAPDPFYTSGERRAGILPLVAQDPAEAASLWWQALGNCRRSLTLLRPRLDENGVPWLPSPYWQAVLEVIPAVIEEIPIAPVPRLDEAASRGELLAALAASGAATVPPEVAGIWENVQAASAINRRRASWEPAPAFEGVLGAADLQAELARRYGPDHNWSASRLNRYGACPYSFFAQHALGLEARPDPQEGLDAMQRGSLFHALLERIYRGLAEVGLSPSIDSLPAALEQVEAACDELFPHAPERGGFRPTALWRYEQKEIRRTLRLLMEWECGNGGGGFSPYRQELRFGISGGELPSLRLEDGAGTVFHLHGLIDRLDRDENGNLRVIDYKSGSTPYSENDILKGLALQAPLYALAVERLLPDGVQVAESFYLHLARREASGRLKFRQGAGADERVQAAVDRAGDFARAVRRGLFPTAPARPVSGRSACSTTCPFAGLCRVDRHNARKGEHFLEGAG